MKLLLVEDDENKSVQIKQFVQEVFPRIDIVITRSLQSGVRQIRKDKPDIVLLDMTLPNYDTGPDESGGKTHVFGGREFLRQIDRFDIEVPVIVITQFETFDEGKKEIDLDTLNAELRRDHANTYRGHVYYHTAIHGWKEELRKLINETIKEAE